MKGFVAFTKKELTEQLRTYKAFILLSVFFIFGMMSPLTAKLLPDILSNMSIEGMQIVIPTPTYIDAYTQFFKNTAQIGIIVILLVFSGIIAQEISKGTLINILSKGLPRHTVILAKYTASVFVWSTVYTVAVLTNFGYTVQLFGKHPTENLFFSLFCLWLLGTFVLAVILMGGTLVNGNYGGLLVTVPYWACSLLLKTLPKLSKYNPFNLTTRQCWAADRYRRNKRCYRRRMVTVLLIFACLSVTLLMFNRKKL
jgi:ABC-2 type transport system permease protein